MEQMKKSDEKLLLIKKRLYQSSTIKNYDEPIYDFTAVSDVKYLLDKLETLTEENKKLRLMVDNGLGWEDMINDIPDAYQPH